MQTIEDRRLAHRYEISLQGIGALESGHNVDLQIVDINTDGARFRIPKGFPLKEKDILTMLIKGERKFKIKAEVRWVKEKKYYIEFGVKFVDVDIKTREELFFLISDYALNDLF